MNSSAALAATAAALSSSDTSSSRAAERVGADAARDAMLVMRARAGDGDAVRELVRRHLRLAHTVARAILGNAADADDACQDAFVAVLARLEQCEPAHRFRPWLIQSVRNRAISIRRRQLVRRAEVLGTGSGEVDAPAPAADDPLAAAERADLRGRLAAAMAMLPAAHREALVLHDVEGWTHDEIAAHLGIPAGTSRSHLFLARRRLRTLLGSALAPGAA